MKVFCYFVEPASYTLDLARNIHDKVDIDYCFISSDTLVKSSFKSKKVFLNSLGLFSKLKYLIFNYKKNDFIIINGYNNYPFIHLFMR